jgi:hypothetical protein
MKSQDEHIDRMLGYLGLFIVGALGWTSDPLGELRTAWPGLALRSKVSDTIGRAKT